MLVMPICPMNRNVSSNTSTTGFNFKDSPFGFALTQLQTTKAESLMKTVDMLLDIAFICSLKTNHVINKKKQSLFNHFQSL